MRSAVRRPSVSALVAVVIALATTLVAPAAASSDECLPLQELQYVAKSEIARHELDPTFTYFCGATAPAQFKCGCPSTKRCNALLSADNRDFGVCECCAPWVYGVVGGLVVLVLIAIAFCAYACCCRGRWWCDGYHPPIIPQGPKRGNPVVAPAGAPLRDGIFRGYRPIDFDTGLTEEQMALVRRHYEQQQQQLQHGDNQQHRRRRRPGRDRASSVGGSSAGGGGRGPSSPAAAAAVSNESLAESADRDDRPPPPLPPPQNERPSAAAGATGGFDGGIGPSDIPDGIDVQVPVTPPGTASA